GDFVVSWQGPKFDGVGLDIYAQRFTHNNGFIGEEFRVNTKLAKDQTHSDVAIDNEGNFVVVWHEVPFDEGGTGDDDDSGDDDFGDDDDDD
ncbi:hypothetical protein KDL45_19300, partial [bacterium]|nr:hypothetical protein [bacterium]